MQVKTLRADAVLTAEVVSVVWFESLRGREALHRVQRIRSCDTTLVREGVHFGPRSASPAASGFSLEGDCPCRDQLADLIVGVAAYLAAAGPVFLNPAGAVRVHVRKRLMPDWNRAQRLVRGAQARTDRVRTGGLAARLPDGYHRAVLEYLVDEAGAPGPLDGHPELLERLAAKAAAEFGGDIAEHRRPAARAAQVVEAEGRRWRRTAVDGELLSWWERYVERPLGRRTLLVLLDPTLPAPDTSCARPAEASSTTVEDEVVATLVTAARAAGSVEAARVAVIAALERLRLTGAVPASVVLDVTTAPERLAAVLSAVAAFDAAEHPTP